MFIRRYQQLYKLSFLLMMYTSCIDFSSAVSNEVVRDEGGIIKTDNLVTPSYFISKEFADKIKLILKLGPEDKEIINLQHTLTLMRIWINNTLDENTFSVKSDFFNYDKFGVTFTDFLTILARGLASDSLTTDVHNNINLTSFINSLKNINNEDKRIYNLYAAIFVDIYHKYQSKIYNNFTFELAEHKLQFLAQQIVKSFQLHDFQAVNPLDHFLHNLSTNIFKDHNYSIYQMRSKLSFILSQPTLGALKDEDFQSLDDLISLMSDNYRLCDMVKGLLPLLINPDITLDDDYYWIALLSFTRSDSSELYSGFLTSLHRYIKQEIDESINNDLRPVIFNEKATYDEFNLYNIQFLIYLAEILKTKDLQQSNIATEDFQSDEVKYSEFSFTQPLAYIDEDRSLFNLLYLYKLINNEVKYYRDLWYTTNKQGHKIRIINFNLCPGEELSMQASLDLHLKIDVRNTDDTFLLFNDLIDINT